MPTTKFKSRFDKPLDKSPVQVKVRIGVKETLSSIPGWQDQLRDAIDEIIERNSDLGD